MAEVVHSELKISGDLTLEGVRGCVWLGNHGEETAVYISKWSLIVHLLRQRRLTFIPQIPKGLYRKLDFSCIVAVKGRILLNVQLTEGRRIIHLTLRRFFSSERIQPRIQR